MSTTTENSPGRAAYEAWAAVMQGVQALPWLELDVDEWRFWGDVASAAIAVAVDPTAADYDHAAEIIGELESHGMAGPWSTSAARVKLAKWRKRAGIEAGQS